MVRWSGILRCCILFPWVFDTTVLPTFRLVNIIGAFTSYHSFFVNGSTLRTAKIEHPCVNTSVPIFTSKHTITHLNYSICKVDYLFSIQCAIYLTFSFLHPFFLSLTSCSYLLPFSTSVLKKEWRYTHAHFNVAMFRLIR